MINSRCPRPMGTRESTALIPVCMGSLTDCLGMIPGALRPTLNFSEVPRGPLPYGGTQSVDNTSEELGAHGNIDDGSSTLDNIALLDELVITKDDNTNVVGLQVESHALQTGAKFHHLLGLDVLETVDSSNTVSDAEHTA